MRIARLADGVFIFHVGNQRHEGLLIVLLLKIYLTLKIVARQRRTDGGGNLQSLIEMAVKDTF